MLRFAIRSLFGLSLASAALCASAAWPAYFDGPGHLDDFSGAVAVDSTGAVVVVGTSVAVNGSGRIVTVKYDRLGRQVWSERYAVPNTSSWARGVAIDSDNSVYVSGQSITASGSDFLTLKYDANGFQQWATRSNRGGSSQDIPAAIAVNANHQAIIVGSTTRPDSGQDYWTVKLDGDGSELWSRSYSGAGNHSDTSTQVALSPDNFIYVGGTAVVGGKDKAYQVLKYNQGGTLVDSIQHHYFGWDAVLAGMKVDGDGNLLLAGTIFHNPGKGVIELMRYDSAGNARSDWTIHAPETSYQARALEINAAGEAWIAGVAIVGNEVDFATVKFDQLGNGKWIKTFSVPATDGVPENDPVSIAVDAAGNSYVTGLTRGSSSDLAQTTTVKYNPNGFQLGAKTLVVAKKSQDPMGSAYDPLTKRLYITASIASTTGGSSDIVTFKY